jgi:hypothetical protein
LAARAAPDGHTLFFGTPATPVFEALLHTNIGYDPQCDFAPITLIAEAPLVLVVSSSLPVTPRVLIQVNVILRHIPEPWRTAQASVTRGLLREAVFGTR